MHACMQMIGTHGAEKHPKPQMRYHHFNNLKLTQRNLLYTAYIIYIYSIIFYTFSTPDSQEDDDQAELQRRPSWKDIYSKRVQRQYRFSEKTKVSQPNNSE